MSYKRVTSLADIIKFRRNCRIACACGRETVFNPFELSAWFSLHGWESTLDAVKRHMRCSKCGRAEAEIGTTDDDPNASMAGVALERSKQAGTLAHRYENFAKRFGRKHPPTIDDPPPAEYQALLDAWIATRDPKPYRVRWADRHGFEAAAELEYERCYGRVPDERDLRTAIVNSWADVRPGAFDDFDGALQSTAAKEILIREWGFGNSHNLLEWWLKQPLTWQERMNGVDQASLFAPDEEVFATAEDL